MNKNTKLYRYLKDVYVIDSDTPLYIWRNETLNAMYDIYRESEWYLEFKDSYLESLREWQRQMRQQFFYLVRTMGTFTGRID